MSGLLCRVAVVVQDVAEANHAANLGRGEGERGINVKDVVRTPAII